MIEYRNHFLPLMKKYFPRILEDVSANDMALAVNPVKPSLIRVDADEVTYGLHIALRFEIEQALFSGDLAVADLPEAWNEKMQSYLGLTPPNFSDGVLQDIHWSFGAFGYFPTYLLGAMYACQIFEAAKKACLAETRSFLSTSSYAYLVLHTDTHTTTTTRGSRRSSLS